MTEDKGILIYDSGKEFWDIETMFCAWIAEQDSKILKRVGQFIYLELLTRKLCHLR